MTEKEWLICFAMFKSVTGASPKECFKFAYEMLDESKKENEDEEDAGIAAVVPKRPRKR